nr:hypothetical protein [Bacillus wiedmannii]
MLAAYDSQEIRETAKSIGIQMIIAINKRNGTRKDAWRYTSLFTYSFGYHTFQSKKWKRIFVLYLEK